MNPYTRYSAGHIHPCPEVHRHEWKVELNRLRRACHTMGSDLREYQKTDPRKIHVNMIGKWNRIADETARIHASRSSSPAKVRSRSSSPAKHSSSPMKQTLEGNTAAGLGEKAVKQLNASQQRLNLVFANIVQNLNNIMAGVENGEDHDPMKKQLVRKRVEAIQTKFRGIAEHMIRLNGENSMTSAMHDTFGRAEAWMKSNPEDKEDKVVAKQQLRQHTLDKSSADAGSPSKKRELSVPSKKREPKSSAATSSTNKTPAATPAGAAGEKKAKTKKRGKSAQKRGNSAQRGIAMTAEECLTTTSHVRKSGSKLENMLRQQASVIQQQAAVIQEQALLIGKKKPSTEKPGKTLLEEGSDSKGEADSGKDADVPDHLPAAPGSKRKKSVKRKAAAKKIADPPFKELAEPQRESAQEVAKANISAEDIKIERSEAVQGKSQEDSGQLISGELQSGPRNSEEELRRKHIVGGVAQDVSMHVVDAALGASLSDSDVQVKSLSSYSQVLVGDGGEHKGSLKNKEIRHEKDVLKEGRRGVLDNAVKETVAHPLEEGEKLDVKLNKQEHESVTENKPAMQKPSGEENSESDEESESEQLIEQFLVNQGLVQGFTHKGDMIEEKFLQNSKKKSSLTEVLLSQYVDDLEDMLHMLVSRVSKQNEEAKEMRQLESRKKLANYSWNDLENTTQNLTAEELQVILKNKALSSGRDSNPQGTISEKLEKIQTKMHKIEDDFLANSCEERPAVEESEDDSEAVEYAATGLSCFDCACTILKSLNTIVAVLAGDEEREERVKCGFVPMLALPVQNPTVEIEWNRRTYGEPEDLEKMLINYLTDPFLTAYGLSNVPRQHFTRVRAEEETETRVYGDQGLDLVGLVQEEFDKRRQKFAEFMDHGAEAAEEEGGAEVASGDAHNGRAVPDDAKNTYAPYGLEGNPFQSEPHLVHCIRHVLFPVLFEAVYVQKYSEQGDANGSPSNSPMRRTQREMRMPLRLDEDPLVLEYETNTESSRQDVSLALQKNSSQLLSREDTQGETEQQGEAVEGSHETAAESVDDPVHEEANDSSGARYVRRATGSDADESCTGNVVDATATSLEATQKTVSRHETSSSHQGTNKKLKTLEYLSQIELGGCPDVAAFKKLHCHHERQLLMRVNAERNLWLTPDEWNQQMSSSSFLKRILLLPNSPPDYVKVFSCGYRGSCIADIAELAAETAIPNAKQRKKSGEANCGELVVATKAAMKRLEWDEGEILGLITNSEDVLFQISAPASRTSVASVTHQILTKLNPEALEVKSSDDEVLPDLFD